MNKTLMTAGLALALGVVWTAGPAVAQTTGDKVKDKAEKAGDKMERAADKTGDKVGNTADKAADKGESKMDRVKDKAESAWDKTKDTARDMKDKVKDKTSGMTDKVKSKTDKMATKTEAADVRTMQQALKDKGHDPGPVDGMMGPRTKAALTDYQRKEGLKATGRWDEETAMKLGVRTSASDKETVMPSASPATPSAPSTPSSPVGTSTAPPVTPEDKNAPPAKRNAP